MSGSIAAIAAYNGSGTQGYGTTDEYVPGVKSVFWNEKDTDKYYVNGSAVSEVPANKKTITSPETIVFTLDNDSDAVSDLKLLVSTDSSFNPGGDVPRWILASLIDRVEICVGNQVISTINTTGLIKNFLDSSEIDVFYKRRPLTNSRLVNTPFEAGVFSTVFNLDIFGNSNNNLNESYLMACANNQTFQVKVYPASYSFSKDDFNSYIATNALVATSAEYTFRLFCNKSTMTNAERDFLRNQVIPKRTNITQFSSRTDVASKTILESAKSVTINCDNFNIYADALYVLAPHVRQLRVGYGLEIEVYLNSTSYSCIIPPEIVDITSKAGSAFSNVLGLVGNIIAKDSVDTGANTITISNHGLASGTRVLYKANGGDVINGLNDNTFYYVITTTDPDKIKLAAEPFGEGDLVGVLDLGDKGNDAQTLSVDGENFFYYKISLANLGITDQDYVPLGRYDSIRVVISPVDQSGTNVAFTSVSPAFYNLLSVIATGKCTGLYQNGAVTFNNY
tara:strand:+ start:1435 stop:2958 length:1524 start_codon:yes stop_codon:yes gene_type:complete